MKSAMTRIKLKSSVDAFQLSSLQKKWLVKVTRKERETY